MGHFYCARCAAVADSHDGCDEVNGRLICARCMDENGEKEERASMEREEQRLALRRQMAERGIE